MHNAPSVPRDRWFAMTMLDENRSVSQLAIKSGRPVTSVKNVGIWGNHSATQFPDFYHATIDGKPAPSVINDNAWLETTFVDTVQKRGAAVIKARGASSAASAANAVLDTVKGVVRPTAAGDCFSAAVCSNGEYGVDPGLIFGYPLTSDGKTVKIVPGLEHNDFAKSKIKVTLDELKSERDTIKDLLPG
jgi:malate dehydrogenase